MPVKPRETSEDCKAPAHPVLSRAAKNGGFTLVELLVAMAIASVLLAAIFFTFKSQQDSYLLQSQVAVTQQNVRAAMRLISQDVQMAGFFTRFVKAAITMNWDDMGPAESVRPLLFARDNIRAAGDGIQDDSDLIVIVKANMETGRELTSLEEARGNLASASLRDAGDLTTDKYALLVKGDLTRAEFFRVLNSSGDILLSKTLDETYGEGDWIYRADIIIYYVGDGDPLHPHLMRRNLGNREAAQIVAEDIENLQFRYLNKDGVLVDKGFDERDVRAVEITVLSRTPRPMRGYTDPHTYRMGNIHLTPSDPYRRRLLKALIKTRNIGL